MAADGSMIDFPLQMPGQGVADVNAACGPCNPIYRGKNDAFSVRRYATGAFTLVGGTPFTGFTLAKGQSITLWKKGQGESGADAGLDSPTAAPVNMGYGETDAYTDGQLVEGSFTFYVLGVECTILEPWVKDSVGGAMGTRAYDEWLDFYTRIFTRTIVSSSTIKLKFGTDGNSNYTIGLLDMFPAMSGPMTDNQFAQVGGPIAGAYLPLRQIGKSGQKANSNNMQVEIVNTANLSWPKRTVTAPDGVSVVFPFRLDLVGYSEPGQEGACDPAVDAQVSALTQQLAQQNRQISQLMDTVNRLLPAK